MATKSVLKIFGTILILYGIFGYIFPTWGGVQFTNNENLWHVLVGLAALLLAQFSAHIRSSSLAVLALVFLALGIYGFTLNKPTDFKIKRITAQLDLVDNAAHCVIGLGFAWFWLRDRKT